VLIPKSNLKSFPVVPFLGQMNDGREGDIIPNLPPNRSDNEINP